MNRVSNQMLANNFLMHSSQQQVDIAKIQKQISSQQKNLLPEDDPVVQKETIKLKNYIRDVDRFQRNIDFSSGKLNLAEEQIRNMMDILKQTKELAIQGANSTYNDTDRQNIANSVDELLKSSIEIANTKFKGEGLFSGTQVEKDAFSIEMGKVQNPDTGLLYGKELIQSVDFQGDYRPQYAEIDKGEFVKIKFNGGDLFTSANQLIVSGKDATNYIVPQDSIIRIDNTEIALKEGDSLNVIRDKINAAHLNVIASIDYSSDQSLLALSSTVPHEIYVEDIKGSSIMQDVGIINSPMATPPHNYASEAYVETRTIFSNLIYLRNALYEDDVEKINQSIGMIDESITATAEHIGEIGATQKRIETKIDHLAKQKLVATEIISKLGSIDMAQSITELKNLENEYQATLKIGANILPKSLLDYLGR